MPTDLDDLLDATPAASARSGSSAGPAGRSDLDDLLNDAPSSMPLARVPIPPALRPDAPSLAQLRAQGKLTPAADPSAHAGPSISPTTPSPLEYLRRAAFGGPNGETALGRAFPSISGARIGDTPTTDLPLARFEELVQSEATMGGLSLPEIPGTFNPLATPTTRALTRGVLQSATELTNPQNLEILAATQGLGVLGDAAPLLGRAVNTGLSAKFAYDSGKGAVEAGQQAYAAHQAGNDQEAARLIGLGASNAIMAGTAAHHALHSGIALNSDIANAIDAHNENAAYSILSDAAQHYGGEPDLQAGAPSPTGAPKGKKPVTVVSPQQPGQVPDTVAEPEPVKPAQVDQPSAATPNAPTASQPTTPEAPETIDVQLQQLTTGQRKVVMFPKGTPPPDVYPEDTAVTSDIFGNVFVFRPDLTSKGAIHKAAKNNKLTALLGSTASGLGAPDKADLQGEPVTVTARDQNGTEVQSTATDQAHLDQTLAAAHEVTPPGGTVSVEDPAQVLAERQQEQVPPPAPAASTDDLAAPASVEAPQPSALTEEQQALVRTHIDHTGRARTDAHALTARIDHLTQQGQLTRPAIEQIVDDAQASLDATPYADPEARTALQRIVDQGQRALTPAPERAREITVAEDKESGTQAFVAPREDGQWIAALRDTDADRIVGSLHVFPTKEAAVEKAKTFLPQRDFATPASLEAEPQAPATQPESTPPDQTAPIRETRPDGSLRPQIGDQVVRQAELPGGSKWAIRKTNVTGTAQLSGSERATADAGQLTPEIKASIAQAIEDAGPGATLNEALTGRSGTALVNALIAEGFFSEQERPALMDGKTGALTQAAKDRISKALLGQFFHDADQYQRFPASLKQKLERVAAPLATLAGDPAWDLLPDLRQAIDLIEYADAHGIKNLNDVTAQQTMFGNGEESPWTPRDIAIANLLRDGKPNQVVNAFRRYVASREPTMFGESTPEEAFLDAFAPVGDGGVLADLDDPHPLRQLERHGWYSQLVHVIESKIPVRVSPAQALAILKNPQHGIKADELKWTDMEDWLNSRSAPVTRQEILDHAVQNLISVEELHANRPGHRASYEKYTLAGRKKDYHELLFTLKDQPSKERRAWLEMRGKLSNKYGSEPKYGREGIWTWWADPSLLGEGHDPLTPEERTAWTQVNQAHNESDLLAAPGGQYRSQHWSTPNVVAHARFDERTDKQGRRILLIEEIQSDWHQQGRERGYRQGLQGENYATWGARHGMTPEEIRNTFHDANDPRFTQWEKEQSEAYLDTRRIPQAPFSKTWHEFVFRRMVRWAAENGFDAVAWTTGKQQAARYDLSRHVAGVQWVPIQDEYLVSRHDRDYAHKYPNPQDRRPGYLLFKSKHDAQIGTPGDSAYQRLKAESVLAGELPELLGKEAAAKLLASDVVNGRQTLEGKSLQLGGHGMRGFYDQILPAFAAKFGKKWGTAVKPLTLASAVRRKSVTRRLLQTVHSLPITEPMRESVMQGQPLFARLLKHEEYDPSRTYSYAALARDSDWEVYPASNRRTARMRLNWQAADLLAGALKIPFAGLTLDAAKTKIYAQRLRLVGRLYQGTQGGNRISAAEAARIDELANALDALANHAQGKPVYLYRDRVSETPVSPAPGQRFAALRASAPTQREELTHVQQGAHAHALTPDQHLPPDQRASLTSHPAWPQISHDLAARGYIDPNEQIIEAAAKLIAGRLDQIHVSPEQANSWLKTYYRTLRQVYGKDAARAVFQYADRRFRIKPEWEEGLPDTDATHLRPQNGSGSALDRGPTRFPGERRAPSTRDARRGGSLAERMDAAAAGGAAAADASLFDERTTEQVAAEAKRDRAQLAGDRLTAQLNAPLSREEQLKNLRRRQLEIQSGLFTSAEEQPPQGRLFDRKPPAIQTGNLSDTQVNQSQPLDAQVAQSEVEKTNVNTSDDLETDELRPLKPYDSWSPIMEQVDALYVGTNAPPQPGQTSKSKGFAKGRGRLYVNEAGADILRQLLTVLTNKRHKIADGLTIPVPLARRMADLLAADNNPRITRLTEAFQRAQAEGVPVTVSTVDTSANKLDPVKRTVRHEEIHRQQRLLSPPNKHLSPSAIKTLLSSPLAKLVASELRKLYPDASDARLAREIPAWIGSGDFAKVKLTRDQAIELLKIYFDLLYREHGTGAVAVLQALMPDLRKELRAKYTPTSGRSGVLPPSGGLRETTSSDYDARRTSSDRGRGYRPYAPDETPHIESEDADEPDYSLPNVPQGREDRPEEEVRRSFPKNDVYLGSGLGALQPGLDAAGEAVGQFTREEVVPKVASILRGGRETVDSLVNLLDPRRRVPTATLDTIYRMKGGRDAANYLLTRQLDKWGKRVDQMTQDQMVNFIDRMKTGHRQVDPELQQLADFMRQTDDALFNEIQKYRPSLEYLQNHYRVLWKVIPGSPEAKGSFKGVFRRPLQGGKGFLKQHKLENMSEGLELGGVPYTYNPVKMFVAHYADAMKFVTAQHLWDEFETMGVRQFVPHGKSAPEGFVRLNDRIAHTYFPVKEGMVHAGDWYVEEGAARVLNNFLSRDLIREHAFGRGLMGIKNATTALELSVSPFHAVFEGLEAVSSQIGIGFRQMYNLGFRQRRPGAIAQGLRTVATAPSAAVTAARQGALAKEAFGNFDEFAKTATGQQWLKQYPNIRQDVQDFFTGGGKIGMHEDYKVQAFQTFREYLKSAGPDNPGHFLSAAIRALPALNQAIMKPLFEHYIPNLKLGFFLREYALAKEEYADRLASGEMTSAQLARQVVDSVENRFGEMNFDNLFWDRTFKTAAQMSFRSVTWKLGNLRANLGAATGQFAELRRAAAGGNGLPLLHPNMAWLLGMALFTAVLGSIITFLGTGKRPQELKDFVYPKIGNMRFSMPTYLRDLFHLAHSPGGYLKSSLSGEIGRVADIWQNKDFYGNEVWHPDDPLPRKVLDVLSHLVPLPFSVSSGRQANAQGGNFAQRAAGYLGFTKAPRYLEQTKAEALAGEYLSAHREVGGRTAQAAARLEAMSGIRNILRRGGNATPQIREALAQGSLRPQDVPKLRQQARRPPLLALVQALPAGEALKVYDAATAPEKAQIRALVSKKIAAAQSKPWEWTPQTRTLAQQNFGVRPPRPAYGDFAAPATLQ